MKIKDTLRSGAAVATLVLSSLLAPAAANAIAQTNDHGHGGGAAPPAAALLASGLQQASGSTIGPDGALYVVEGKIGQVTRVDTRTGAKTPFVTGLPRAIIPIGGPIDVAFVGRTAYVLVANVGDDVPGSTRNDVDGIYRVDGPSSFTVVADIGDWSLQNPPPPDIEFFLTRGVLFAMEPVRGGFLVTDGHHNRLLEVTSGGVVSEAAQFGNIVPTGLAVRGPRVYMAEAGPVPHLPETGRVVTFGLRNPEPRVVASGASLLVDVEFGPCGLYALSQGDSPGQVDPGAPALPDSGELLAVTRDGAFRVVAGDLDLPTSVAFQGGTAYVTTLNGEVWKVSAVSGFGKNHGRAACIDHRGW
ncbi:MULTISPECIES: ScyD/ScyE family protein [Microbacterium]|uniref:ScyD/ScyE family protein n=1 Tax=Microbacterium saccharophilum TaxID=1213358 RepID=A0A7Z7CWN7_9MICO|nr:MULTISPECIES: ScyD/ScyE family protein [Microbacterium]SFI34102.1 hypothetical protein SAMN04487751_1247 [Microbacterium saccharophilum]